MVFARYNVEPLFLINLLKCVAVTDKIDQNAVYTAFIKKYGLADGTSFVPFMQANTMSSPMGYQYSLRYQGGYIKFTVVADNFNDPRGPQIKNVAVLAYELGDCTNEVQKVIREQKKAGEGSEKLKKVF